MSTAPRTTEQRIFKVLVGIDFGEQSDTAFDQASRLAAHDPNGELHLVHVIYESDAARGDQLARDDARIVEAYEQLRRYVARRSYLAPGGAKEKRVHYHVRLGSPAQAIHQTAVDVDADLLVVGTQGLKGIERLILGSVAETLVKEARLPVLVAKPQTLSTLAKTPSVEPPRPGTKPEDLHKQQNSWSELVTFGQRDTHISGLL